jgi:quercetin dioxygenase-like cupin family protein
MKTKLVVPLLAGALGAVSAFAGATPPAPPAGLHPVVVPAPSAEGAAKEVAVVADLPGLKIVAITLRAGTALPEHSAGVPVTIQAAHGSATITVGGAAVPLGPGAFVVLDANTPHAVAPVGTAPVTVLVHHHKGVTP